MIPAAAPYIFTGVDPTYIRSRQAVLKFLYERHNLVAAA